MLSTNTQQKRSHLPQPVSTEELCDLGGVIAQVLCPPLERAHGGAHIAQGRSGIHGGLFPNNTASSDTGS